MRRSGRSRAGWAAGWLLALALVFAPAWLHGETGQTDAVGKKENAPKPEKPFQYAPIAFAPSVGYQYLTGLTLHGTSASGDRQRLKLNDRHGVVLTPGFRLGKGGLFALHLDPFYAPQITHGDFTCLHSLGLLTGVSIRAPYWEKRRVWPYFGIGARTSVLLGGPIRKGVEVLGRLDGGVSWYVSDTLGIEIEVAGLYGGTGLETGALTAFHFGSTFGAEVLIGIRVP